MQASSHPARLLVLFAIASTTLAANTRPRILGVSHIALKVSDIDKSRVFYRNFLGYTEPLQINNADGTLAAAFVQINDRQYVELLPGLQPDEDRMVRVALYTDDAERMRRYLASRGWQVPAGVQKGRTGNLELTVNDPDGHSVQFVQYEPQGWPMREKNKAVPASRISPRMLHLGILVGNLEAARKFYTGILGFEETWRGGRTQLQYVNTRVPDGEDYIEYILYKDLPPPNRRGSAHHICLEAPDVAAAIERLESNPVRQSYGRKMQMNVGMNRRRQVNLFDPDGTRVEVMESTTIDGQPAVWSDAPPPSR